MDFEKAREKSKVTSLEERRKSMDTWFFTRTTTMSAEVLRKRPEERELLLSYFPTHASTAVVAMGGIGKTTWIGLKALLGATDFDVMFVSAEDGDEDYQSKLHNTLFSEDLHGQPYHKVDIGDVAGRIHVLNLKGSGVKLISDDSGSFVPSQAVDDLISYIKTRYPRVRLVIFETVSRFAGGEDNDRMEALVTAADRIAIEIDGACALVHHTGKSQARDKVIDLYSGRGGSALGDNTRSMIVMTRLDDDYAGQVQPLVSKADLDAGKVFEVMHVRNSYGPTMPPEYYVTRAGYCNGPVLEQLREATEEDKIKLKLEARDSKLNSAATKIHKVIKAQGGHVSKKFFDSGTQQLIGLTQKEGRDLIAEMLEVGSLIEKEQKKGKTTMKILEVGQWN